MPKSTGFVGITEGRGMKLAMGVPIDPLSNSDDAMNGYLASGDILEILQDDDDSLPAVERRWGLEAFGDADIVELCAQAWLQVASVLTEVFKEVDGPAFAPHLSCLHNMKALRVRAYDRQKLKAGTLETVRV